MIFETLLQNLQIINIFHFFEYLQYYIDINEIANFFKFTNKTVGTIITVDKRRMFQYTVFTQPVLMYLSIDSYEAQLYIRYMHTLYHVNPGGIFLDLETGLIIIKNPGYFYDTTHWWAGETYDYLYWAHSHLPSSLDRDWFDEDGWYCGHWIKHYAHETAVEIINSDLTKYTWRGSVFQHITEFPDVDFPDFYQLSYKRPRWFVKLMLDDVLPPLKTKLWWEISYNFPDIPKFELEIDYSDDYSSDYIVEKGRIASFFDYIKTLIKDWVNDWIWSIKGWWSDLWEKIEKHFRVKEDDD